jgi:hypothetical protein
MELSSYFLFLQEQIKDIIIIIIIIIAFAVALHGHVKRKCHGHGQSGDFRLLQLHLRRSGEESRHFFRHSLGLMRGITKNVISDFDHVTSSYFPIPTAIKSDSYKLFINLTLLGHVTENFNF